MKKKLLVVFVLGLILTIFQFARNIYVEPNPLRLSDGMASQPQDLPFRVSPRTPASAQYLYLLNARNTVVLERTRLREKHPYYYRISLATGEMVAMDYLEKPIAELKHCLSTELIESLQVIMRDAQICESPEIEVSASHIHCSMDYTLPYGTLEFFDSTKISLGEKQTSCDYPTALCGDSNGKLIEWSRKVLVDIKKLRCPSP